MSMPKDGSLGFEDSEEILYSRLIEAANNAIKWSRENAVPGNPESIRRLEKAVKNIENFRSK